MPTVKVLDIHTSPKPNVLASVKVEIQFDDGDSLIIDDARVLRNRVGQLWLAMPAYSVPIAGGRGYDYLPALTLSTRLRRQVEDAATEAFENWHRHGKEISGGQHVGT